jgi:hypothetical protein
MYCTRFDERDLNATARHSCIQEARRLNNKKTKTNPIATSNIAELIDMDYSFLGKSIHDDYIKKDN